MTVTYTITDSRPNTDHDWYGITDAMQTKIDQYKSSGDLVSWTTTNHDELNSTTICVFRDSLAEATVCGDVVWYIFAESVANYYEAKGFTQNVTRTEE